LNEVSILGDDGKKLPLIMKDGKIYKNTLVVAAEECLRNQGKSPIKREST